MFDENVELKKNRNVDRQNVTNSIYMIKTALDESKYIEKLGKYAVIAVGNGIKVTKV